jgi:hypothetical protein
MYPEASLSFILAPESKQARSKQAAIAYQHDIMYSLLESPSTAHTSIPSFLPSF